MDGLRLIYCGIIIIFVDFMDNEWFFSYIMVRTSDILMRRWCAIWFGLDSWNNCLCGELLLLSDTLFWFRANQSLLLLVSAVCLAEKQQMPIYSLWFVALSSNSIFLWYSASI
jgi:hypothetical protein